MKKGTKVSWQVKSGDRTGTGTVIADEDESGHVQIAVESITSNGSTTTYEEKYVIYCAATWLAVADGQQQ